MTRAPRARVGDLVIVHGHRLGEPSRMGEILDVLGGPEHEHYRVQWEDGHTSTLSPAAGCARIEQKKRPRARTKA